MDIEVVNLPSGLKRVIKGNKAFDVSSIAEGIYRKKKLKQELKVKIEAGTASKYEISLLQRITKELDILMEINIEYL